MSLKRLLLFIALMGGLAACDGLPGKPDPANRYVRPEKVTDFDTLYSMNCSGCHGADGRFGPAIPLGDPVYLALAKPEYIEGITRTGVSGTTMPAFALETGGTLTDQQIAIIAQGLHTKWGDKGQILASDSLPFLSVSEATEVGNAERGKNTFRTFCAECHGPLGRGNARAGSVVRAPLPRSRQQSESENSHHHRTKRSRHARLAKRGQTRDDQSGNRRCRGLAIEPEAADSFAWKIELSRVGVAGEKNGRRP